MKATGQNRIFVAFIVICDGTTTDAYAYGNSVWVDLLTAYKGNAITYDPFGKPLTATGTMASINPLRYRGYYYDTESGLYYVKARYYDPEICRWINADDASNLGIEGEFVSYNVFVYCGDNPILRKDDGGEFWHIVAGAAIGAVINVATSYVANTLAGNDYTWSDAAIDAASGAITGAFAASGAPVSVQRVVNGFVNATVATVNVYRENKREGKQFDFRDAAEIGVSFAMGVLSGDIGGDGLTYNPKISKQIDIINRNLHCAFRDSASRTIKRSLKYISQSAERNFRRFASTSFLENMISAVS